MKVLGTILFASLVAGCSTMGAAPTIEQVAANDDAQCLSYGFKFGTDGYANCRLQLQQSRAANARAAYATWQSTQRPYSPQPTYVIPTQPRTTVNCNSMAMGNMVNTSCY